MRRKPKRFNSPWTIVRPSKNVIHKYNVVVGCQAFLPSVLEVSFRTTSNRPNNTWHKTLALARTFDSVLPQLWGAVHRPHSQRQQPSRTPHHEEHCRHRILPSWFVCYCIGTTSHDIVRDYDQRHGWQRAKPRAVVQSRTPAPF
jgi:hypothetical protein